MTIRIATPADAETLVAFNQAMAHETEDKLLDAATVEAGVQAVFEDPSKGFYIVAEREGEVVGSLMITYEWSDWRNGVFWWIQSVYVSREARRQGVYTALHDHVRMLAEEDGGVCGLRLYVERENAAAQRTYEVLGMQPAGYRMYEEML